MNSTALTTFCEKYMTRYKNNPLPRVKQPKSKQKVQHQVVEEEVQDNVPPELDTPATPAPVSQDVVTPDQTQTSDNIDNNDK